MVCRGGGRAERVPREVERGQLFELSQIQHLQEEGEGVAVLCPVGRRDVAE